MIEPFVAGTWQQPMIRIDLHEAYQAAYCVNANEIRIDLPGCSPDLLVTVLDHELVHWAHFQVLEEEEDVAWVAALAIDSSIFHRIRRAMELAASWSPGCSVPDYQLMEAEYRRTSRIVKHRDGSRSWRHIPLVAPITAKERQVCARLEAIQ